MYILLTGAKKNIGDFLIADRSKRLLKHERPERKIVEFNSWESLDTKIDEINSSKAIIIHGGPGYQYNMYPGVYPLTKDLNRIQAPIIPMAMGWKGVPGDDISLKYYKINNKSIQLLMKIHDSCEYSGCRDYLTKRVLAKYGIKNAIMTGCSVWYDVDCMGQKFVPPSTIRKIAFTPPQLGIYRAQAINMLEMLIKKFPNSEIMCSFHRGTTADKYTSKKDADNVVKIVAACNAKGVKVADVSYDLSRLAIYDDCDIHIGYRLHGHLLFLSRRKPSFLLNEDGRGRGAQEALGLQSCNAFERTLMDQAAERIGLYREPRLQGALNILGIQVNKNRFAIDNIVSYLEEEMDNGFERYSGAFKLLDTHYEKMRKFIKSLP